MNTHPFLTFLPDEQAVISHTAIMDLEAKFRRLALVSPNGQCDNLVGNIRLSIEDNIQTTSTYVL
ncbi:hypothetical protein F5Y09DRAFT_316904 [Xylaria sp. FL1042]|nr:hypothetical protein F5Y09DRAFT_316904 [Xylaria sp. FL1042]